MPRCAVIGQTARRAVHRGIGAGTGPKPPPAGRECAVRRQRVRADARVTGLDANPWVYRAAGYAPASAHGQKTAYFAAVLPKRLRKRSTRPPMLSTDFCVPV